MPTLSPIQPVFRAAVLLATALAGPFALARITVRPALAHLMPGEGQSFTVRNAQGATVPGTWEPGRMDLPTGAWVAMPLAEAGRLTRVMGRETFTAGWVRQPTVVVLRFTPAKGPAAGVQEPAVLVPVRVTPAPEALPPTGSPFGMGASSSSGSAHPGPVQGAETPLAPSSPAQVKEAASPSGSSRYLVTPPASNRSSLSPAAASEDGASVVFQEGVEVELPADPLDAPAPVSPTAQKLQKVLTLEGSVGERLSPPKAHKRAGSQLPMSAKVVYSGHPDLTLGAGSNASVVKVTVDDQAYAAKLFPREIYDANDESGTESRAILGSEWDILKSLKHENIIGYQSMRQGASGYFLIMEMAQHSLADVHGGPMDEASIREYAWQMVKGLAYLQEDEHQVVHGDFKGANMLITRDGHLKLADFGSAQRYRGGKVYLKPGFEGCTLLWAAPEMLLGGFDGRADIWAFGCVLLELLSEEGPWGERHFHTEEEVLLHLMTGHDAPAIPAHASGALRALVARCLQRDPDQRPWARELLEDPCFRGMR